MEVYVKIYETAGDVLVAVCDENILGEKFFFKGLIFEVKESFYRGEKKNLEEIKPILERATILNLVGVETVRKCIEWKYIKKDSILYIGDTVHAQMVRA